MRSSVTKSKSVVACATVAKETSNAIARTRPIDRAYHRRRWRHDSVGNGRRNDDTGTIQGGHDVRRVHEVHRLAGEPRSRGVRRQALQPGAPAPRLEPVPARPV